jgi:hypothetical protein
MHQISTFKEKIVIQKETMETIIRCFCIYLNYNNFVTTYPNPVIGLGGSTVLED